MDDNNNNNVIIYNFFKEKKNAKRLNELFNIYIALNTVQ